MFIQENFEKHKHISMSKGFFKNTIEVFPQPSSNFCNLLSIIWWYMLYIACIIFMHTQIIPLHSFSMHREISHSRLTLFVLTTIERKSNDIQYNWNWFLNYYYTSKILYILHRLKNNALKKYLKFITRHKYCTYYIGYKILL